MSEPCTGHGLYLSGVFEIEEKLTQEQNYKVEFRSYSASIYCGGLGRKQQISYEIRATGFSSKLLMLEESKVYFLRGSFFPTNTEDTFNDEFFYEGIERMLLGDAEAFTANVEGMIGLTGLGRVLDVDFKVEECWQYLKGKATDPDLKSVHAIVEHCDFHPETKLKQSMTVEYRIPPFKHLLGSAQVVKKGRECNFHGYIRDFNKDTSRYVVQVNKVSPTSGHLEVTTTNTSQAATSSGSAGRSKAKNSVLIEYCIPRFKARAPNTPFKSPLTAAGSSSGTPLGPSDTTPSSADSTPAAVKSKGKSPASTDQPPKKRARAAPKRKAAKGLALNESSEEL
ncbi:uncharacterized protein MELLADRAFT_93601 [Melampsora larici-populina 98AG31]|uniref:Uncharacterized protein n=1 Tax=Melampsora larici-populina (strain 98AG31 / pathotype 3-4-7) TaxID=747676 RepID=F4RB13_MELLP|nr:uncharacterized protein MELLADRAFT_93601 [Melampsora larici-populina 98AG31]EGG10569.1 hypothetical protein MELLADRAFT_93601 [Melampsora larici-populina 98AG31]